MASGLNTRLPETPAKWQKEAKSLSIDNESIHSDGQNSASKITFKQFMLLRVVFPELKDANKIREACIREGWLKKDNLNIASAFLEKFDHWKTYKKSVGFWSNVNDDHVKYHPGTFALALRYQRRSCQTSNKVVDTPNNIEFSPPQTRNKSARSRQAAVPDSPTPGALGPLDDLYDALPSTSDSQPPNPDDNLPKTPLSVVSLPSRSQMTPYSPIIDDPRFLKAVQDEQTVNYALILFLESITIHYPRMKAEWLPDRYQFVLRDSHAKKVYEARVDGAFLAKDKKPRMIVEVKPYSRWLQTAGPNTILMQEAAQMAAWIADSPPKTAPSGARPHRYDVCLVYSFVPPLTCSTI